MGGSMKAQVPLTVMACGSTVSSSITGATEAIPCLGTLPSMLTVIGHTPVEI